MSELFDRIGKMYGAIDDELTGFGGYLRCETCGAVQPLGSPGEKVKHGWPKCCGYTMRWWTQRQIDAGDVPPSPAA